MRKLPYCVGLLALALLTGCRGLFEDLGAFTKKDNNTRNYLNIKARPAGSHVMPGGSTAPASPPVEIPSQMVYLDNGVIRVGLNMDYGGSVTYLSAAGSKTNLVNNYDLGRQIQYSFYSWPIPYNPPGTTTHPVWKDMGWDPIQTGDVYGYGSKVTTWKRDGNKVTFTGIPLQWAMKNVPCECRVESTVELSGIGLVLKHRFINARTDQFDLLARGQNFGGGFVNGEFYKAVSYSGTEPFTNGPLTRLTLPGPKGDYEPVWFFGSERWAALENDAGLAVGVWTPDHFLFNATHYGERHGGEFESHAGTIATNRWEVLDRNIVIDFMQVVMLGSAEQIRQYVYQQLQPTANSPLPHYEFTKDRQQWYYMQPNLDSGLPFNSTDGWRVRLDEGAGLYGPAVFYKSPEVPVMYLRAAFKADNMKFVRLQWTRFDGSIMEKQVPIISDGQFHDYEIQLTGTPGYDGAIIQFNLVTPDNRAATSPGDYMKLRWLSHKKP